MTLFQNKYRIETARLQNWDYSSVGSYFITLCIKDRNCILGTIQNGESVLSASGNIIKKYWLEIPRYSSNFILDEYCIMPNHMHGIICITDTENLVETPDSGVCIDLNYDGPMAKTLGTSVSTETSNNNTVLFETPILSVSTNTLSNNNIEISDPGFIKNNSHTMKSKTIGNVINQFKRICTIEIRKHDPSFAWQPRFYDHIIRDEAALQRIRDYIHNNPLQWENDEYHR